MIGSAPIAGSPIAGLNAGIDGVDSVVVVQIATVRASVNRRHDAARRALRAPVHPTTVTIQASDDARLADSFQTRVGRSRRALAAGWMAALTTVVQAPAFPYASVVGARSIRRRETAHRLVTVVPLHWPYIAPTVAAILKPERANVIEFRTRLQLTPKHDLFPPATGPPEFSFAAVAATRAKRRHSREGLFLSAGDILSVPTTGTPALYPSFLARELPPFGFEVRHLREPFQPDYPETQVTVSDDRALAESFVTRVSKRRKKPIQQTVLGVDAAAPVTPYAPVSALTLQKARGRKARAALFLSSGDILSIAPSTPVAYPAFLARTLPAARFRVKVQRLPLHLVFPATPPVPPQPLPAWQLPVALTHESRYRLVPADPQLVFPETPYTPPTEVPPSGGWLSSFDAARIRREKRRRDIENVIKDVKKIPDRVSREIAEILWENEAKAVKADDLKRIQAIADEYSGKKLPVSRPLAAALIKAYEERSSNALEQLERMIAQHLEEEEMALLLILLLED